MLGEVVACVAEVVEDIDDDDDVVVVTVVVLVFSVDDAVEVVDIDVEPVLAVTATHCASRN